MLNAASMILPQINPKQASAIVPDNNQAGAAVPDSNEAGAIVPDDNQAGAPVPDGDDVDVDKELEKVVEDAAKKRKESVKYVTREQGGGFEVASATTSQLKKMGIVDRGIPELTKPGTSVELRGMLGRHAKFNGRR